MVKKGEEGVGEESLKGVKGANEMETGVEEDEEVLQS